jgi:SanA protein
LKAAFRILPSLSRKNIFYFLLSTLLFAAVLISFANFLIVYRTSEKLFSDIEKVPVNDVGLLLGTSKFNRNGQANQFFANRIQAAADLYFAGKIKHIIVSGDNREHNYNEPRDMRRALVKKGIPESAITLDFAGFRTLDSVVRAKKVFARNKVTVISQRFHNQRAVFIGLYNKMEAVGFNAADPPDASYYPTFTREVFARFKAVIDLYVLKQKPKFLGKQENILIQPIQAD